MTEWFAYNARQYFDFSQVHEESLQGDTYFLNQEIGSSTAETGVVNDERGEKECSDAESDSAFFSPMTTGISTSTVYLKSTIRRSLSMNNLPIRNTVPEENLHQDLDNISLNDYKQNRAASSCSLKVFTSKEHINRLAQPKRFASHENLPLAEAVQKFQTGTPKRFRTRASPKLNKLTAVPWGGTKPHSPHLLATKRNRYVSAISKEEQERLEVEEAKKFKIRANPINKKAMKGPLKSQVDKKPSTIVEPFHLTEMKKKRNVEQPKAPTFRAQPLPKSLHDPFKLQRTSQTTTQAQTPNFSKRLTKTKSLPKMATPRIASEASKPLKLTKTQPVPFSFEKRDQELLKKKEALINKVMEEEKKAREFHAKPPPKSILRPRNSSQDLISETGSLKSFKQSSEELETATFKARPAKVLTAKPFEPKKDENHMLYIEAFQFSTDERAAARQKFEQQLKEKEEIAAAYGKQQEELLKQIHDQEVAKMRKEAEHKAQPVKKYKAVTIMPSNKVTNPISPKFHTDRIRNKENIED